MVLMNLIIMFKLRVFVWYVLFFVWLWCNNLNVVMVVNINVIVIFVVVIICKVWIINDELNIVFNGWIFIIWLFLILKLVGVFINELIDVIKNVENEFFIIMGIDMKKCVYLFLNFF